jgi:hypothetical protein
MGSGLFVVGSLGFEPRIIGGVSRNSHFSFLLQFYIIGEVTARMLVPKMVKNGFNSVLRTSAGSRRLVAVRNSGTNAKSKTAPKSQKANKNHFRPI